MPPEFVDIENLLPRDLAASFPSAPAVFSKKVTSYTLQRGPTAVSVINIFCEDGYQLVLTFLPDPLPSPPPTTQFPDTIAIDYESEIYYLSYVDMLRNEPHAWVTFDRDKLRFRITATKELYP